MRPRAWVADDVIYDVGMHKGEDSAYYLALGFRVVGIEANPELTAMCHSRFASEIAEGRMTIIEGAISDSSEPTVKLFLHPNTVWGTTRATWAKHNGAAAQSREIMVPTVRFTDVLRCHGIPYYLKVDIEGADELCLRALLGVEHRPRYVSVEAGQRDWRLLKRHFTLLGRLGYDRFAVVQQGTVPGHSITTRTIDGVPLRYTFEADASGPFGEDVGPWTGGAVAWRRCRRAFLAYRLLGHGSLIRRIRAAHGLPGRPAALSAHPMPGWHDLHATRIEMPSARRAVGVPATHDVPLRWPSVTVVVPTRGDRCDLLRQTVEAITSQDYPGEIDCLVVLDPGSADLNRVGDTASGWEGTRAVAEAAGARVLENDRPPGLAGARNTGYLAATGELVANCDDDDYWLPGKLLAQVMALTAEPWATLVCCGIIVEYGETLTERLHPARVVSFDDLLRSRIMALHASTFVARRAALLDDIGLVSEEIPGSVAEDYELLLRAARSVAVLNVPLALVHVRWHTQRGTQSWGWSEIAAAMSWLLESYPEFRTVPAGYAWAAGRAAFAAAACGGRSGRSDAWKWVRRALRANPREPRALLALAVMAGLAEPDTILRWLHRRGRGL